ncbi:DUF4221 family protein [Aquiflexum sp.]|uniref:DUF4221 family protein n=1 Tax=Aquiflexum sp. TaxID=1872584 RepID=UPI0035930B8E
MKNLLFAISMLFLFSCGGGNEEKLADDFSNITFTIDTVMVDSKGEFLFLQMGLRWSDVSTDGKYFFNFNINQHHLEVIDLEKLELEKIVPFDKEGPNGTGSRFGQVHSIGKDSLYFSSLFDHEIFDWNGKKIKSNTTKNVTFSGDGFGDNEALPMPVMWSKNADQIFGLGRNWMEPETSFIKIDFAEKSFHRMELPAFDIMKEFHYTMEQPKVWFGPEYFTSIVGEKVMLSIAVAHPIYTYNISNGQLDLHTAPLGLTAEEKSAKPPKQVRGIEENRKVDQMLKEQINFMPPIWDEKNKRFYRFSYEEIFPTNGDEFNLERKAKVYLTALDENFSILSEQIVSSLEYIPSRAFVKEGNIWIPVNIDDELGFVRFSFMP